jgi:hypothetical protein
MKIKITPWLCAAALFSFGVRAQTNATANAEATAPMVGVQELLKQPDRYAGKPIVLEGFVTDYCKRKGCWANIHDNDSDSKAQLRVKQDESDSTFKAFEPEVQGRTVHVTGELKETKIDRDYLDKWEARVKAAQAKADKARKTDADDPYDTVLKQIAGYRERVARSTNGHLTSLSFAVTKWEVAESKAEK